MSWHVNVRFIFRVEKAMKQAIDRMELLDCKFSHGRDSIKAMPNDDGY